MGAPPVRDIEYDREYDSDYSGHRVDELLIDSVNNFGSEEHANILESE